MPQNGCDNVIYADNQKPNDQKTLWGPKTEKCHKGRKCIPGGYMHSGQVDMTRAWTGMAPPARCRHAGIRVTAGEKALIPLYMYFSDFLTCISLIVKTIFLRFKNGISHIMTCAGMAPGAGSSCRHGRRCQSYRRRGRRGVQVHSGSHLSPPVHVAPCTHPPSSSSSACRLENLETDRMPS